MSGFENYTFMPAGGGGELDPPPPLSQLVVVRFSKSWAVWFRKIQKKNHAKFY